MSQDSREPSSRSLSPDEAFEVLGDETRLQILQALGEAGEPLSFSEIFDRITYEDYSNFGYHLDRLVGPFVRKTDDGYALRRSGGRVMQSILSGAVTDSPVLERSPSDWSCVFCGEPADVGYREGAAILYCSSCAGLMSPTQAANKRWIDSSEDIVGFVALPPAGVYGRSPTAVLEAGEVWTVTEIGALVRGVCPRCASSVERSVSVCGEHEADGGPCPTCEHRFGVAVHVQCTNCIMDATCPYPTYVLGTPELMAFMLEHDIDPIAPDAFHIRASSETIRSTDPLRAEFAFTADDESLVLTVDDSLSILDTRRT